MYAFGDSITVGKEASNYATLGYAGRVAATLGLPLDNRAVSGVAMNTASTGILAQMLLAAPPPRQDLCVLIAGTNDMGGYGTDATRLAEFTAALQEGLLYLTSRRRSPEPKSARERALVRQGRRLSTVADGCRVYVGNTPKQVTGSYVGLGSPAAQALYAAAVAAAVANVAARGRRVYLVDVASAYDPATQGNQPPSGIHPGDSGHLAIANAFLAAMGVS